MVNGRRVGTHTRRLRSVLVRHHRAPEAVRRPGARRRAYAIRPTRHAAARQAGARAARASGTRRSPASGRRCGSSPCLRHTSAACELDPDAATGTVSVRVVPSDCRAQASPGVSALDGRASWPRPVGAAGAAARPCAIPAAKLWSPDESLPLRAAGAARTVTRSDSYFGMRSIAVARDAAGVKRLFLNGKPLFQFGLLDQGWWPDGLYTAPTDEALRFGYRDDESARASNHSQAREGRAGALVLPLRSPRHAGLAGHAERRQTSRRRTAPQFAPRARARHRRAAATIRRSSCGCRSTKAGASTRPRSTSRGSSSTIPPASSTTPAGGPTQASATSSTCTRTRARRCRRSKTKRAAVLGEFGGLGLPLEGHTWLDKGNWGYRSFTNTDELGAGVSRSDVRSCASWSGTASPPRSTRRRPTSRSRSTA